MFARGLVSLHTPPLLGRKSFEAKSRVSISSKLIENKRLQVLYFGHLRKTGGTMYLLKFMLHFTLLPEDMADSLLILGIAAASR
jgi:hypothetical protein